MKRKIKATILSLFMAVCTFCTAACGTVANATKNEKPVSSVDNEIVQTEQNGDEVMNTPVVTETEHHTDHVQAAEGTYNEGVVLVKSENSLQASALSPVAVESVTRLTKNSKWYTVTLKDASQTHEAISTLREMDCFDNVDYDYIMKADGEVQSVDVSSNPDYASSSHFGPHDIDRGWHHAHEQGKNPGGSSDVVVAVIDTGVDYNHLDLRNNIWVNSAEIPDNGIDDDGNGYIDDINGWNCVGDNNNPMDDNGHGTHVAGIVAAENNEIGSVGVAYNSKIMCLKAGNSSGYFNNSDVAEAVEYAYMNGATVINMSFGGSNISIAVEEALENAYYTSILVAAAGNEIACNQPGCYVCVLIKPTYPAVLPYVIGVMSCDTTGNVSAFSNFDHYSYNDREYEVYAVGESVFSTWPNNKYAVLNGTSMAAPSVAGIAALLRSYYTDREVYSSKFIQSQIVNTGTIFPDGGHSMANAYEAMTKSPKPTVNLYGYTMDDSVEISAVNNGNGVIDAGETVRLYISLQNRGGVASNVTATIDTIRNDDASLTDPYFTFNADSISLSDIGTYSVRESTEYFEIVISPDCPNDYLTNFNIRYTYTNGMDTTDTTAYSGKGTAQFNISRGYHLPATIMEDTVYTADRLYIVGDDVVIPEGVTVTFEEGCEIQFYDDREYYNSPMIKVYGTLNIQGSKENTVYIHPSEMNAYFAYFIECQTNGMLNIQYANAINLFTKTSNYMYEDSNIIILNSFLRVDGMVINEYNGAVLNVYENGIVGEARNGIEARAEELNNCYFEIDAYNIRWQFQTIQNSLVLYGQSRATAIDCNNFINNIICSRYIGNAYFHEGLNILTQATNNMFYTLDNEISSLIPLRISSSTSITNNHFSLLYQNYALQTIEGYLGEGGDPRFNITDNCSDISLLYPHVVSVELFNKDGELVNTIGKEEITVRITFNRPMDTTQDTAAYFGTREPYADYKIEGEYISDTVWEGTYTLKAQIENGQNYIKVSNACAAEDQTMEVLGKYMLHEFTIDTTAAMSMNLQAVASEEGITLTWAQDDYDTLMGYNIYRSTVKDGNYVKINPSILLSTEESFLDTNAEPGVNYWYTFTVVLSDFSESAPAGKVSCTAMDTLFPNVYHTPVNQGYLNNNLVISCTASDNIAVANVTLYYRTVGETAWKTLSMSKVNDKYSATVFGSELSSVGLEYYIEATDGRNVIAKGSEENPYTVVIKDSSALSKLGDVDGDNVISTKDALMIMQCINGDLIMTDDEFKRADLNEDGILSSVEALRILQYINGNVTTLAM